mmetsp:Transcript_46049/g.127942  ORF Transcript_46049/g.127942 Transcript_46049/m.127942 type:complete len:194 (-) Transcript_46049:151-732(-)|eukprot:CAMPEP_0117555278 /NCGR_PEP_ID=MMETSP0784-20121206/51193_1 /TAXON_ID=39447 /ORGANISM="" /LENGTH=193 /DNA_ID=CAMNT_0005352481 /DNA_START=171 /DNA_END=752 /DNA_ORIENTATION=+
MDYVTKDIQTLWKTEGFAEILDITLLPYGNAEGSGSKIECQHGPNECEVNMVEACAIKHLPSQEEHLPFIFCSEAAAQTKKAANIIESCSPNSTVASSITGCFGGGHGDEGVTLENAIAKATQPLHHKYTPWVVLEGRHSAMAEDNLEKAICRAYKGSNRPPACAKYQDTRCHRKGTEPPNVADEATATLVTI